MAFTRKSYAKVLPARKTAAGLLAAATLAATSAAYAPARVSAAPQSAAHAQAAVTPPDGATVLYFIHQIDGKGATSYEVANRSIATYWFGHAFELEGTRYFTGFAWETAERYGKPGEDDIAPTTPVNLSEATFILDNPASDRPWKFRGMEPTIGEFGAYERAPDVDTTRKPVEFRSASGKLVLAVPTETFENGITIGAYTLLVFTPPEKRQDESKDKVWAYAGNVLTGEDNSLACDEGNVMPCTHSEGELIFSANGDSDMPLLTVRFTGTTISGPGKTRKLGDADNVTYVYDAARKEFVAR
ncbi:hypothetical protein [Achromobacter arsenitoxydans]|uniref:Lipoprotein n=1 Tax=Achromobacter arsenitoxydans SY8 TaxID=477184 RepID=H0F4S7_9BURK|nr:hypothetical protein [Achromobacter arsenitoxydans]EHK66728.1 hypothetical protein KYC_08845 [Achromobacter arsenitoxydans SY8]